MPHATVRAARLRIHSTDLACDVSRGIGYSYKCACGSIGKLHRTHAAARAGARRHMAKHRDS